MKELKVNQLISASRCMLIDEEGKSAGEVSLDQALYLAFEKGYDLVQMNDANPPLCKLMDYGKYIYSQEKQLAKQKAKSRIGDIKEVRLSIKIDSHDLDVKINQIKKFLNRGDKVKVSVQLMGRQMAFREKARELIEKVRQNSESEFEKPLEQMGNRFFATIVRKNQ